LNETNCNQNMNARTAILSGRLWLRYFVR
jgi:hypothetical protein